MANLFIFLLSAGPKLKCESSMMMILCNSFETKIKFIKTILIYPTNNFNYHRCLQSPFRCLCIFFNVFFLIRRVLLVSAMTSPIGRGGRFTIHIFVFYRRGRHRFTIIVYLKGALLCVSCSTTSSRRQGLSAFYFIGYVDCLQ